MLQETSERQQKDRRTNGANDLPVYQVIDPVVAGAQRCSATLPPVELGRAPTSVANSFCFDQSVYRSDNNRQEAITTHSTCLVRCETRASQP